MVVNIVQTPTVSAGNIRKINGKSNTPAPILKKVAKSVHTKSFFPIFSTAIYRYIYPINILILCTLHTIHHNKSVLIY